MYVFIHTVVICTSEFFISSWAARRAECSDAKAVRRLCNTNVDIYTQLKFMYICMYVCMYSNYDVHTQYLWMYVFMCVSASL